MIATIKVSCAELLDRITILEIKAERLSEPAQLANVASQLAELTRVRDGMRIASPAVLSLGAELKTVNESLWDVENEIRACERAKDFGPRFVELARSVYRWNDRRAALKSRIDALVRSPIRDEKSYTAYE